MELASSASQIPIVVENTTKHYNLKYNDKAYILKIALLNQSNGNKGHNKKEEKVLNFHLTEKISDNENKQMTISYESYENLNELGKLFLINVNKYPDITDLVLSKIDNFHSKHNATLICNDNISFINTSIDLYIAT